jgi:hypothetical protein
LTALGQDGRASRVTKPSATFAPWRGGVIDPPPLLWCWRPAASQPVYEQRAPRRAEDLGDRVHYCDVRGDAERTLPRGADARDQAHAGRNQEVQDAAAVGPDRNALLRERPADPGDHHVDHSRLDQGAASRRSARTSTGTSTCPTSRAEGLLPLSCQRLLRHHAHALRRLHHC